MSKSHILLGVNIDHVATLRQARFTSYPSPIKAALYAQEAGADSITVHLREDRRHIQEHDIKTLKKTLHTRINLEIAPTSSMVKFALQIKPNYVCLVPEKRVELTTEGGLNVIKQEKNIKNICGELKKAGIKVSLFIDPQVKQIDSSIRCKADLVELHTGAYANASTVADRDNELERIKYAAHYATKNQLTVNGGHGLNLKNITPIAAIDEINELHIGHSIISRAIFIGLKEAIYEVKKTMLDARLLKCTKIFLEKK